MVVNIILKKLWLKENYKFKFKYLLNFIFYKLLNYYSCSVYAYLILNNKCKIKINYLYIFILKNLI
jgi:hypothetical protein